MNQYPNTPRRNPVFLILSAALYCAVIVGVAAWTATLTPVLGLNIMATPTSAQHFALVQIAKPVMTPTSDPNLLVLPTNTQTLTDELSPPTDPLALPTDIQIQTPEAVVQVEIVESDDLPVPEYDAPAPIYSGNKYILVDISEQHMYVYEGETLVYSFVSSTGMDNATRTGYFSVLDKIPNAYGATWDIWMPNWLGIYWAGSTENGIHALPILPNGATLWAGYLGVPISYGCVVLGTYEAQLLYDWVDIGTPVEIRW